MVVLDESEEAFRVFMVVGRVEGINQFPVGLNALEIFSICVVVAPLFLNSSSVVPRRCSICCRVKVFESEPRLRLIRSG